MVDARGGGQLQLLVLHLKTTESAHILEVLLLTEQYVCDGAGG
jgi:hypothetical protein